MHRADGDGGGGSGCDGNLNAVNDGVGESDEAGVGDSDGAGDADSDGAGVDDAELDGEDVGDTVCVGVSLPDPETLVVPVGEPVEEGDGVVDSDSEMPRPPWP